MAGGMVGDVMTEYQDASCVETESISSRLGSDQSSSQIEALQIIRW